MIFSRAFKKKEMQHLALLEKFCQCVLNKSEAPDSRFPWNHPDLYRALGGALELFDDWEERSNMQWIVTSRAIGQDLLYYFKYFHLIEWQEFSKLLKKAPSSPIFFKIPSAKAPSTESFILFKLGETVPLFVEDTRGTKMYLVAVIGTNNDVYVRKSSDKWVIVKDKKQYPHITGDTDLSARTMQSYVGLYTFRLEKRRISTLSARLLFLSMSIQITYQCKQFMHMYEKMKLIQPIFFDTMSKMMDFSGPMKLTLTPARRRSLSNIVGAKEQKQSEADSLIEQLLFSYPLDAEKRPPWFIEKTEQSFCAYNDGTRLPDGTFRMPLRSEIITPSNILYAMNIPKEDLLFDTMEETRLVQPDSTLCPDTEEPANVRFVTSYSFEDVIIIKAPERTRFHPEPQLRDYYLRAVLYWKGQLDCANGHWIARVFRGTDWINISDSNTEAKIDLKIYFPSLLLYERGEGDYNIPLFGIQYDSNSCYQNAVLQFLFTSFHIREYVRQNRLEGAPVEITESLLKLSSVESKSPSSSRSSRPPHHRRSSSRPPHPRRGLSRPPHPRRSSSRDSRRSSSRPPHPRRSSSRQPSPRRSSSRRSASRPRSAPPGPALPAKICAEMFGSKTIGQVYKDVVGRDLFE